MQTAAKSDDGQQGAMRTHTRLIGSMTLLPSCMKGSVDRALELVRLISLLASEDGTSHERVSITNFRSISDMVEASFHSAEIN